MFPIQLKIIAVLTLVIAAYAWHANTVSTAVETARTNERNAIVLQYSKQSIKLIDNAYLAEVQLQDKIKRITNDKQKELTDVNAKYDDLLGWLSSQSSGTGKQTSIPNGTSNPEGTTGTNGQGLLQGNAKHLIEFAKQTEELKVHLLSCYKQYDQVLEDQQKFRLENTDRKP